MSRISIVLPDPERGSSRCRLLGRLAAVAPAKLRIDRGGRRQPGSERGAGRAAGGSGRRRSQGPSRADERRRGDRPTAISLVPARRQPAAAGCGLIRAALAGPERGWGRFDVRLSGRHSLAADGRISDESPVPADRHRHRRSRYFRPPGTVRADRRLSAHRPDGRHRPQPHPESDDGRPVCLRQRVADLQPALGTRRHARAPSC
jgi:hypothetical protein